MALEADDEILQDFLVEASEIVEQLGEQLVDLEQQPDIRLLAGQRHLLLRFHADHALVQADVVQYAAKRVVGVVMRGGVLDGFADGDAETAGAVRVFL